MSLHPLQKIFWKRPSNFSQTPPVVFHDARNDGCGSREEREYSPCTFNPQNLVKLFWRTMW